jgi:hypothetical protein
MAIHSAVSCALHRNKTARDLNPTRATDETQNHAKANSWGKAENALTNIPAPASRCAKMIFSRQTKI